MPDTKKAILITGATGKQGGATIDALIEAGALDSHRLLAVTRNTKSAAAQKLEARGITLIQGDLNDIPDIFANAKVALGGSGVKVWGVFSVQVAMGDGATPKTEEAQGKALVDAALANGVEFFVYASVDRGGASKSYDNPTPVPHFASKYNVEHHLLDAVKGKDMQWTILRPTAFMEDFLPGFEAKLMTTAWRLVIKEGPLQLIAIRDIGWFAAQAFLRPGEYAGRSISLAGDEPTLAQANATFKSKVGSDMPQTFRLLARFILWLSTGFGGMFRWFGGGGFGADVKETKAVHPGLLSWSEWLDTVPEFTKKAN